MVDYVPTEKAMPIRQPSTANLMIDSFDRDLARYPSAGNFQITKKASILNGFFTRIGTTEVVMEWNQPNIQQGVNDTIQVTVAGDVEDVVLDPGFYTVQTALDQIALGLSGAYANYDFDIINGGGIYALRCRTAPGNVLQNFTIQLSQLATQLGFPINVLSSTQDVGHTNGPDLRIWRYIDIVSTQLTYAQDLKDSSTARSVRDVLCRWYFAWDGPPPVDGYDFPIFQGYQPFQQRRIFNPPKQIRWEPNLPVGNLAFEVYGRLVGAQEETSLAGDLNFEFLMTLQVSEQ